MNFRRRKSSVLALLAFSALVVGGVIAWRGSQPRLGLVTGVLDDRRFERSLTETFPIGSDEARLAATLRRQGFVVATRSATLNWSLFPCAYLATVTWTADEGRRLRSLQGHIAAMACV